jgi:YVTN family beta-propeller protein
MALSLAVGSCRGAVPGKASLLVLNKAENTMAIVDPATFKVVARVETGEGPHEVAVSADGRTAYVGNYGTGPKPGSTLSVIDLVTRKEIRRVDLSPLLRPHGLLGAGGKVYFTAEANRVIARYDPAANKVDWIMGTGQNVTHMLAATPDGKKLYTANILSDSVTALSTNTGQMTHIPVGKQPEGIAVSPDGKEVWVGHNGDGHVSIIDTATDKVTATVKVAEVPIRVTFTPNGKRALVSDPKTGEVIILDAAARKELKRLPVGPAAVGVLVEPEGRRAFIATMAENKVVVVDLEKLERAGEITPGQAPDGLAWAVVPA